MATDLQPGALGGALTETPKVFGLFSMVLFSVSAILVADTVGSSAAMGVQGLGFWIILGLLFFIPYGFVTAELGSAWPDEGGIYVWVKTAFGPGWGTVTSWMYWVNVALWAPSVFVLFIGAIEVACGVDVPPFWEAVIVIAMVWAIVLVGILPLRVEQVRAQPERRAQGHRARRPGRARRRVRDQARRRQLVRARRVEADLEHRQPSRSCRSSSTRTWASSS